MTNTPAPRGDDPDDEQSRDYPPVKSLRSGTGYTEPYQPDPAYPPHWNGAAGLNRT